VPRTRFGEVEQRGGDRAGEAQAGILQVVEHRAEVFPQEEHLSHGHPLVRGHLERPQLHEAQTALRARRIVQLVDAELGPVGVPAHVDEQVAEEAVGEPGRDRRPAGGRDARERELQLVEGVVARLVQAGSLRRGADEQAGEEERQRRMVLEVSQHARQEVRPPHEWALDRRRPAERQVVAAAAAHRAPIEVVLLGREARPVGRAGHRLDQVDVLPERGRHRDVHLQDSRVGRHLAPAQARIRRRAVALQPHRDSELGRGVLDRGHAREFLERVRRRDPHAAPQAPRRPPGIRAPDDPASSTALLTRLIDEHLDLSIDRILATGIHDHLTRIIDSTADVGTAVHAEFFDPPVPVPAQSGGQA
jgi:hypothetical protein